MFIFRDIRADRITKPLIEKFITKRKSQYGAPRGVKSKKGWAKQQKLKKISNATVNRELACLKKMFSNLVADGVLANNPVKLIEFLEEDNESGRVIDKNEEILYLKEASQPLPDYATILVETGLRPEELCRLGVKDVFLEVEGPYLVIREGKTKSAKRTVPLSKRAESVLLHRIAKTNGRYIFPGGKGGTELNKPAVKFNNAHYGTLTRCQIDGINRRSTEGTCTLYSFRHTCDPIPRKEAGDFLTLAALLGHSSLRMVMRYAHPSDEHKFEAIRSMEKTLPEIVQSESEVAETYDKLTIIFKRSKIAKNTILVSYCIY